MIFNILRQSRNTTAVDDSMCKGTTAR